MRKGAEGSTRQVRPRTTQARHDNDHAGHLLSCAAWHEQRDGGRYGRSTALTLLLPKPPEKYPGAYSFLAICRQFRSGGTRIRTGDTMIFSHAQGVISMRVFCIPKLITVR